MAHGGRRRGAGRKEGLANTRTREIADRAAAKGITPLEYLLHLLRKPYPKDADAATLAQYDAMKADAAKAAAPYMHPRLAPTDAPAPIGPLTGDLASQGRAVIEALSSGAVTPSQAATIMQVITAQARIVEADELVKRVAALEAKSTTG
jgi:hypothetical protein